MPKDIREKVLEYASSQYGISPDRPWIEYPENEVLRHPDNNKWFALLFPVKYDKLGVTFEDKKDRYCDILNAKCEPMLIDMLIEKPGFTRAYHMNKTQWITVFLDGSVVFDEIKQIIDLSYDLTKSKPKRKKNASKSKKNNHQ